MPRSKNTTKHCSCLDTWWADRCTSTCQQRTRINHQKNFESFIYLCSMLHHGRFDPGRNNTTFVQRLAPLSKGDWCASKLDPQIRHRSRNSTHALFVRFSPQSQEIRKNSSPSIRLGQSKSSRDFGCIFVDGRIQEGEGAITCSLRRGITQPNFFIWR